MDLKTNRLAHIRYTRATDFGGGTKGEVTDRVIIPTYIPGEAVKALDVSDYSEKDALTLQTLAQEYNEYVENKMRTVFSFEDWIDHTYGSKMSSPVYEAIQKNGLKFRTFKPKNTEVIKSE